jgi:signal transduction histidine kinase
MIEQLSKLFDPTGFVPRRACGRLGEEPLLVETLRYADLAIWLAYLAIPTVILVFLYRKRTIPFQAIFLLFVAFILSCGFSHFVEAILIETPVYRLSAVVKVATALVSWITVLALIPTIPRALALRTPEELEREIAQRIKAQRELERARDELELRVRQRTEELEHEVAERRRIQEEREQLLQREMIARTEAVTANRTKDEFLATLSHELRTPLNAMLGWVQLIRTGRLEPEMVGRGMEVLEHNTRMQAQLIDDLLDVSRIITGKLIVERRVVLLRDAMQRALDSIRPTAEVKGVRLIQEAEGNFAILGDATRIQQILWNLLSNAVKFTPRSGTVTLRSFLEGASVVLQVQDTGEGIAPEALPFIFDRFRQADSSTTRKHGGLGLGLAIVRHLVELHGGTVDATSKGQGQGSTFTLHLPIHQPTSPSLDPRLPKREDVKGLRILVVEDAADTLELLDLILSSHGAQVLTCRMAQEALRLLSGFMPDLIISDIGMPEMDGYAFIRSVRQLPAEQGGAIPAIALTAMARSEDREAVLAAGYQLHLCKPIVPSDLLENVRRLVGWVTTTSL